MLETRVHLESASVPAPYQLFEIDAPDTIETSMWTAQAQSRNEETTRSWGDAWLEQSKTALARVPSMIMPAAFNWLIDPSHPDAARIEIVKMGRWPWDDRLFASPSPRRGRDAATPA